MQVKAQEKAVLSKLDRIRNDVVRARLAFGFGLSATPFGSSHSVPVQLLL